MKFINTFNEHIEYESYKDSSDWITPNLSYCRSEDECHFNRTDPTNGYEYVDMGFPSGTLWAKCNVGAENEYDMGLFFAIGETTGYYDASSGKTYSFSDYKYADPTSDYKVTKYNSTDQINILELEDDAAYVNMGHNWRTPSQEQCEELINNTYVTKTYVTNYNDSGKNGVLVTSNINGNTLFFPHTGYLINGVFSTSCTYYMTTMVYWGSSEPYSLFIDGNLYVEQSGIRYEGYQVRAVFKNNG